MGLPPGTRLGPYEILAPLGAGGMGEVFRAHDTRLGRQVAVKILPDSVSQDSKRVTRFETEARALAALSHPNILAIHDFGQSDGRLYAVTELLDGETLRDRMAGEPVVWRKAAEIAAAIADGLASAHAAGIVHRDLKPENVFITSDGRVKVLDFGLAKVVEPVSEDAVTLTSPSGGAVSVDGEVVGTLSYMAPEQLRGLKVDGRTDIFALGCVLYEMLSGKRPFAGATPADTLSAILRAEPSSLDVAGAEIPPALGLIVSRCLEKRPEDRFDTAHDLALSLRSFSTNQQPAGKSAESPRPVRRRRIVAAAAIAAAAVLVVFAIYLKWPRTSTRSVSGIQTWGPPRQITGAPGWEAEPELSPDGTLVAYSSNASGNAEIWVVDPEGGEPLRLTDGPAENRSPAWFPDGRSLAFASTRSGPVSVWKVSRLGGSASLLLENADMPAISPDGTRIAFSRSSVSGDLRIWVAALADPFHAKRLTGDEDGQWNHMDPAWSGDGKHLCYSDRRDLWLVPADGGKARRLTHDGRADGEPAFSPDGLSVYFSSFRDDPQSVWRVTLNGGAPERVTFGTGTANHPSLSGDGRRLVFSTRTVDREIVLADRKTGTVCRLASSRNDHAPALALDGNTVVYVSNRLGRIDLWTAALESGCPGKKPPHRLTNLESGPAAPVFSPDGNWVAFFRVVKGKRGIWAVRLSGGSPVALVDRSAQDFHPAYSPDGTRLAFISDRSGREHVWILPLLEQLPAGEPWRLTDGEMADMFPAWSADGRRISFIRGNEAWVVEARPRAVPRRITDGAEAHHVTWDVGESALLVTGLFGTPALQIRRVVISNGARESLKPNLVLGNRDGLGNISVSRDGRFLATDVTETKGTLWITAASRDGR